MPAHATTFLGIVLVLTITPGADMALVMRNVLAHGFRAVWPTLAGILSSLSIHVTLCILGLSVVLQRSDIAFSAVKFAGAAWLAWLGLSALWTALRPAQEDAKIAAVHEGAVGEATRTAVRHAPMDRRAIFLRGFFTNLLNVKIALFYIAFLPQFAPAGSRFVPVALGLAAIQAIIGMAWLTTYGALVAKAGDALAAHPKARRWLEGSTGAALVGFGLRLATAAR
jgi:threonine/homoserine/homoserine lactone efflux protein